MTYLLLIIGLGLLLGSGEFLVRGSVGFARAVGLSPLFIGLTLVGFGTSAPEIAVATLAALDGAAGVALGNAYGSNIANIGLILGLTAAVSPIAVHSRVVRRELPILLAATGIAIWLLGDRTLDRVDAAVLLAMLSGFLGWTLAESARGRADLLGAEVNLELTAHPLTAPQALIRLALGLVVLVASSRLLVWGAVSIAATLGVSELIIGLTVVAIGTSLPELASSLVAARRGEHDIVLGNLVGSNLFNTLAVVGVASLVRPLSVPEAVLYRDAPVMAMFSLGLFALCARRRDPARIGRLAGGLLLAGYSIYNLLLARAAIWG